MAAGHYEVIDGSLTWIVDPDAIPAERMDSPIETAVKKMNADLKKAPAKKAAAKKK